MGASRSRVLGHLQTGDHPSIEKQVKRVGLCCSRENLEDGMLKVAQWYVRRGLESIHVL
jgi:hypothetical protein